MADYSKQRYLSNEGIALAPVLPMYSIRANPVNDLTKVYHWERAVDPSLDTYATILFKPPVINPDNPESPVIHLLFDVPVYINKITIVTDEEGARLLSEPIDTYFKSIVLALMLVEGGNINGTISVEESGKYFVTYTFSEGLSAPAFGISLVAIGIGWEKKLLNIYGIYAQSAMVTNTTIFGNKRLPYADYADFQLFGGGTLNVNITDTDIKKVYVNVTAPSENVQIYAIVKKGSNNPVYVNPCVLDGEDYTVQNNIITLDANGLLHAEYYVYEDMEIIVHYPSSGIVHFGIQVYGE